METPAATDKDFLVLKATRALFVNSRICYKGQARKEDISNMVIEASNPSEGKSILVSLRSNFCRVWVFRSDCPIAQLVAFNAVMTLRMACKIM